MIGQFGNEIIMKLDLFKILRPLAPVFIKCSISVISMICNFFMMLFLVEKV